MQDYRKVEPLHLVRTLGVSDLVWLYMAAVVNLNFIPVVAAEGGRAIWLWGAAILLFFIPQGIAVLEFAERMPGEGGLYLWTKETYGDFSGFVCGWCYWLTNMFFVPSLLFYVTGVTAYTRAGNLAENRLFFFALTTVLLWLTILANIRGLGVGKWVNNIGGIGSLVIAFALVSLAALVIGRENRPAWNAFALGSIHSFPLPMLAVVCLAMVGLEIGPVMGDEVHHPRRTFARSIFLGGVLCAVTYVGATLALVVSVPQLEIGVVQGLMQAIDRLSKGLGVSWVLLPLAVLMVSSIVGSTSAWVSGSARILFVCGLDRYLPKRLGRVHPRFGSPHVALTMFGLLSSAIIAMSFAGASVKDAYLTLLDLAVALQMISYLYLFASLMRLAFSKRFERVYFRRAPLCLAGVVGLAMTLLGFVVAFVPSSQISSIWSFELKMFLTFGILVGIGCGLFVYYRKQRSISS